MAGKIPLKWKTNEKGCWTVISHLPKKDCGYLRICDEGKYDYVHRLAYKKAKGEIPQGKFILHSCDNRLCINPEHLRVVTRDDNALDMVSRKRQSRGEKHPLSKLTLEQAKKIRKEKGYLREIGKRYGVSLTTIWSIKQRKSWKEIDEK